MKPYVLLWPKMRTCRTTLGSFPFLYFFLLCFCLARSVEGKALDERFGRITAVMEDNRNVLQHMQVGVLVYDITEGVEVYAMGSDQVMRPASCLKILTAVTVLELLGTNHMLRTDLSIRGHMEGDTLMGDIVAHGACDPLISTSDLSAVASALLGRGIRHVNGRLVVDKSIKDTARLGWGWCWDDDNPPLSPLICDKQDHFAETLYRQLMVQGVEFIDGWQALRTVITRQDNEDDLLFQVHISHPIGDVIRPMLKNSDNLYAENMFYRIAATSGRIRADRTEAASLIKEVMRSAGCTQDYFEVADGSGLSQYTYISPRVLVAFLRHAYQNSSLYQMLFDALPVAAEDGTLKNRMKGTAAAHRIHAKTGTVTGVSSLAGYAQGKDGHLLAFAIICQGVVNGKEARSLQDHICEALL